MGHTLDSRGKYDPQVAPALSDALAINYADSVATLLRAKFTGARITREVSSTAQVGLAALAGAGAVFNYSTRTIAVLGLGSAGIPELQGIFNAKGRAEVYQDAVRLIEEAQVEYLAHNQRPSATELTQNGVTLFQRVTASIHVVEKTLAGRLPTVIDMQQATEPMSPAGAVRRRAGSAPVNVITQVNPTRTLKLPPPSASQRRAFDPNAPNAITEEIAESVRADRRIVGSWVSERVQAGDMAALQDLVKAGGVTESVAEEKLPSRARRVVETATTREKVDLLLPVTKKKVTTSTTTTTTGGQSSTQGGDATSTTGGDAAAAGTKEKAGFPEASKRK